jgi:hypothetical protein
MRQDAIEVLKNELKEVYILTNLKIQEITNLLCKPRHHDETTKFEILA